MPFQTNLAHYYVAVVAHNVWAPTLHVSGVVFCLSCLAFFSEAVAFHLSLCVFYSDPVSFHMSTISFHLRHAGVHAHGRNFHSSTVRFYLEISIFIGGLFDFFGRLRANLRVWGNIAGGVAKGRRESLAE